MNFKLKSVAVAMLAVGLVATSAYASDPTPPAKKQATTKKAVKPKTPPPPSVADQIQTLKDELESQINGLKSDLAAKDAQLKKAQQAAAEAQAAADRAQAAADAGQAAVGQNAAAVSTLQTTVTDLKGNQVSLATTVSDETSKIKKSIESPDTLHYKGVTLTPYGFFNGESVYRTHATGGEMATPFSSIPYEFADAYATSEMYISGRQSRVGFIGEGKLSWATLRARLEGDFLGTGTTSNDNQSTSYLFRQRIVLGELEMKNGFTISAGQGWSLTAENTKGISTAASNIALPMQIDPNYVTGLVWARSGSIRVTDAINKYVSVAVSAENPQLLYTASLAGTTPYAVVGTQGVNGGLLNAALTSCSPSTTVVNYTNQVDGATSIAVPVYKTTNSCANLANISFNMAPDMVVKVAFDPGYGHYELFGVGRFFHETVYPGETTNSNLYGNIKDIATGTVIAPALTTAGSFINSTVFGGVGGSMRLPIVQKMLFFGAKGLFGPGVGHFGDSTLSDATSNYWGGLAPIHNASGLLSIEATPNPRLTLYGYYGGDYAGREDYGTAGFTTSLAAPSAQFCPTTAGAFTCTATPTAANMTAGGSWGPHWAAPSNAAVGYGSRLLSNSGCTALAAPGFNGSSTGYYPGGSCGAQTRDVQEITGGYWYDIYKGDRGRLRQGVQYGYSVREGWSGASGIGAKGIENMFFTSLRYYLP
jgi:hypothetical protein